MQIAVGWSIVVGQAGGYLELSLTIAVGVDTHKSSWPRNKLLNGYLFREINFKCVYTLMNLRLFRHKESQQVTCHKERI